MACSFEYFMLFHLSPTCTEPEIPLEVNFLISEMLVFPDSHGLYKNSFVFSLLATEPDCVLIKLSFVGDGVFLWIVGCSSIE